MRKLRFPNIGPFRLGLGLILFGILLVLGGVLPWFAPNNPLTWYKVPRNQLSSWSHLLGTTNLGQDIFWLLTWALQNLLDSNRRFCRLGRRLFWGLGRPRAFFSDGCASLHSEFADLDPARGSFRRSALFDQCRPCSGAVQLAISRSPGPRGGAFYSRARIHLCRLVQR
jgi:hypothetical protein